MIDVMKRRACTIGFEQVGGKGQDVVMLIKQPARINYLPTYCLVARCSTAFRSDTNWYRRREQRPSRVRTVKTQESKTVKS